MKIKLTILFLLNYILVVHTQTILENTSFIIGGQLHEVNPLGLTQYPILSPEIGIAYTFKKIPVRLTYRRNFNYGSSHILGSVNSCRCFPAGCNWID